MRIIDSISRPINYGLTFVHERIVTKIALNSSASKKALQFYTKTHAVIDLYYIGKIKERKITEVTKGTADLIEFYGSYKNLMYWINLFSKDSIDQEALKESIKSSICDASHLDSKDIKVQEKLAQKVCFEVMNQEAYHSKSEVLDAIKLSLENHGYSTKKAKQMADQVIVKQKARSPVQLFYMVCFTVADLGSNILTLKKWEILDLSHLVASVGSQSRIFMFVMDLGADVVLGTVASAGLILVVGEVSYRIIAQGIKLDKTSNDTAEKEAIYKELRGALISLVAGGVDLTCTVIPLIFTLNPLVLVTLSLVSKGTGLVCILIR